MQVIDNKNILKSYIGDKQIVKKIINGTVVYGQPDFASYYQIDRFDNYTVVGSPTIENGIVSEFSSDNKLTLPSLSATNGNPFEMQFAFTSNTTTVNALLIFYGTGNSPIRFGVFSSNRPVFRFHIVGDTQTAEKQVAFNTVTSMNTKYIAKAVYDGTTVNCYLYNGSGTLLQTFHQRSKEPVAL